MSPFDDGYELFKKHPDLMLVEVWHFAATLSRDDADAFVSGYQSARAKRDAYQREVQS